MEIKYVNPKDIVPYAKNAKLHDSNAKLIANSIKAFGFKQPVLVDEQMVVISGHGRLEASKLLKLDSIPIIIADDLTEAEIKAYRIADNKVAEKSTWDNDLLKLDIEELEFDMVEFGFSQAEMNDLFDWNEPEEEPEPKEENGDAVPMEDDTVIIIRCASDEELEETFNKLFEEGYDCKLTTY